MPQGARFVVEHFNKMVEPDGGSIVFLGLEGGTLRVRYTAGPNPECAHCVITPQDLRALMGEALELHDPSVTNVVVETAP